MSSRSTLGTVKRIVAILLAIAIVLAAGVIVGQAPALFGVEEELEASIEFEDQHGEGENVTVAEVALSDGGFVVITDDDGQPLAVSDYLEAGSHENVTVERNEDADDTELLGRLTATVHQDTTDDESYAYAQTDGTEDHPYLENGFPVTDTATVTTTDDEGLVTDSFTVDAVDGPSTVTTNETPTIVADISNPTDLQSQQPIEFRIDGQLVEQQTLDLEAGESREIAAEIDMRSVHPGERTIGVYTDGDGMLVSIDVEFHAEPMVAVREASDESVTVDAAIPAAGFVAIEHNETDETLGTSASLEPGEHDDIRISLDENATIEADDELRAVLYEGDPDDLEAATVIEDDDGDPVEATITLEDDTAADDASDDEPTVETALGA
ncbi:DUF4179 domain-containing protein [Salinadaptatus halalkaliphilus]|uniref:DUF4179 domain-containing protein n=1 Tax=Salinadaptatus halalkaliphilus TaxID=2419781 RepID=A0A4S3TIS6_9EURY|nr:DUF4179 domain-containing protein [Salinadaptatus halalkaliphilus]THE63862.1 DUF4179 domain-containing protein [Salinadaptatus halalkaliphilus]